MADQLAAVVGDVEVCNPDHSILDLWVCLCYRRKRWSTYSMDEDEVYVRRQAKRCDDRGHPTRVFHVKDA